MQSKVDDMRAALRGINGRILLIPAVAMVALAAVGAISVSTIGTITLHEREARTRVVVEAATKIVEAFEAKAAKGEMPEEGPRKRQRTRSVRSVSTAMNTSRCTI